MAQRHDQQLLSIIETCLSPEGEDEKRLAIGRLLLESLDADYFCSYLLDGSGPYAHCVSLNVSPGHLGRYDSYFRHRDLLTPTVFQARKASMVDSASSGSDPRHLEFNVDFLRAAGFHFGMNYFPERPRLGSFDFRIWRGRDGGRFGQRDLHFLQTVGDLLDRHWSHGNERRIAALTPRELDVAREVAAGRTDREICRILGIAQSTLRTHLSKAFSKLGSGNRSELTAMMAARHPHF